jgi:hypothetical protein
MVVTIAGLAGNTGSTDGIGGAVRFNGPCSVAVDNHTNIYVADSINCTIRGTPLPGQFLKSLIRVVKEKMDGTVTLAWSAKVGHTYQVQYTTDLSQSTWNNLTNVTASSWTGIASVSVGTDPQRFYRVVLLP